MSFAVPADAYDRFMGRFSERLAPGFADFAGVEAGMRALDVGCGPGALTAELAARLGGGSVAAADPTPPFVEACKARVPDADVRQAPAEQLPFEDGAYDVALAQLVVSFMRDAPAGIAEMHRVLRPGGRIALCSWAPRGHEMLSTFWRAASEVAGEQVGGSESTMRYRTSEELIELASGAGFAGIEAEQLEAEAAYDGFEDYWSAIETAAGPVGDYYGKLGDEQREAIRAACERLLPAGGPFTLRAVAWAVRARR